MLRHGCGFAGPPLKVTVHISVLSMGPISEKDMEFTIDCYFRQIWIDERMKFDGPMEKLPLASKVLKEIWRPDTYVKNGRKSYLHTLTMPNVLLRVKENGEVYVSQRLTIRARCPMFLQKFPMDTQACPIYIGSLGYNQKDVVYEWQKLSVSGNIELSQYKVIGFDCSSSNDTDLRDPNEPSVSVLNAFFLLERQQGFYVLQIYTPCTLIVVMSWVSFWLNKEASPARVSLGIMTVLTMSTLGLGARDDLPKVSYATALDIYIVACFGFVFSAMVEYAIINFAHIVYVRKSIHEMIGFAAAMMNKQEGVKGDNGDEDDDDDDDDDGQADEDDDEPSLSTKNSGGGLYPMILQPAQQHSSGDELDTAGEGDFGDEGDTLRMTPEKPRLKECFESLICHRRFTTTFNRACSRGKNSRTATTGLARLTQRAKRKIRESDPGRVVDKVDTVSKFLFPLMYCAFNFFYWAAYLYWIPDEIRNIPMVRQLLDDIERRPFASNQRYCS